MHWWRWWARRLKPRPKITAANFWNTDLEEIDRQTLAGIKKRTLKTSLLGRDWSDIDKQLLGAKKITDLPIQMHIDGIPIENIKR